MTWMLLIIGISWMLLAALIAIFTGRSISMRDKREALSRVSPSQSERWRGDAQINDAA